MKKIMLGGKNGIGKFVLVDDDDYEYINKHRWHCVLGYAVRRSPSPDGKRRIIFMHRLIANTPDGMFTDHINGDKLDNRKENLRVCTNSQNQMNRGVPKNNSTGFKGVYFSTERSGRKYIASSIQHNKKTIYIGRFRTLEEASEAYQLKAKELFGEFASKITREERKKK